MHSLDRVQPATAAWLLLRHELRLLLTSHAFWIMLLILWPLLGYSFIQATSLYTEASRSALQHPELGRGITPLDGMLVPTLGALYLAVTLLFPFVAIRAIGEEKHSGTLKLTLQLPVNVITVVMVKTLVVGCIWLLALLPAGVACAAWLWLGGHLHWPELITLLMGHAVYALAVISIAFFGAAVTDSVAAAAIVTLAITIGFWVLDFAAAGQVDWLARVSSLSITATLREFERGLFALPRAAQSLALAAGFLAATVVWLPPGRSLRRKACASVAVALISAVVMAGGGKLQFYADMTEDRRNSFSPADEAALREMRQPLSITLYLAPEDSRAREMESNVLAKLRHTVPDLRIHYGAIAKAGMFGPSGDDRYGIVMYEYADKREESRSNSAREILPILHALAGRTVVAGDPPQYTGYPLIVDVDGLGILFYLLLPVLTAIAWWAGRRA